MNLEDIGFYTLSNDRAKNSSVESPMWRCELILTGRCNFKCPYCRGLKNPEDIPMKSALFVLNQWISEGLKNVRFSGGEPTLYQRLDDLVRFCVFRKLKRIAVSTNGYSDPELYRYLYRCGVNDFSISLDACCSMDAKKMSGGVDCADKVLDNIKMLSKLTYVSVGVVLTDENMTQAVDVIKLADSLGVSDIRVIPAAQENGIWTDNGLIDNDILERHPILKYRINNFRSGFNVRGLRDTDCGKCRLIMDDSVVCGEYHYPCVIYMREGGSPIGKIGKNMRQERIDWMNRTDTHKEVICKNNCLDVCRQYNNYSDKLARDTHDKTDPAGSN